MLFCIVRKLLERRVCIKLYNHVNNSSVLYSMAFREIAPALHGCYLFLIPLVKTSTKMCIQTNVVYLDFAQAFDSVDPSVLPQKL